MSPAPRVKLRTSAGRGFQNCAAHAIDVNLPKPQHVQLTRAGSVQNRYDSSGDLLGQLMRSIAATAGSGVLSTDKLNPAQLLEQAGLPYPGARIADGFPYRPDVLGERVFVDDDVRPKPLRKLLFGNYTFAMANQVSRSAIAPTDASTRSPPGARSLEPSRIQPKPRELIAGAVLHRAALSPAGDFRTLILATAASAGFPCSSSMKGSNQDLTLADALDS